MTAALAAGPRRHYPEFDLLRGAAAAMMVVNHTALFLLPGVWVSHDAAQLALPQAGPLRVTVWLGSFAPAVFFFVTGLGYGVQAWRPAERGNQFGLLRKAAVLFAADALMWLSPYRYWGFDFFAFIGLSMLVLAGLRTMSGRRSVAVAVIGLLLISVLRVIGGPLVERALGPGVAAAVDPWIGRAPAHAFVSFPLLPWLAFPLLGYALGAWLSAAGEAYERCRLRVIAGVLAAGGLAAAVAAERSLAGSELFRWGSVSVSYYLACFAVLAGLSAWVAWWVWLMRRPVVNELARPIGAAFTLRGVSAFAVVPLHFAIIGLLMRWGYDQRDRELSRIDPSAEAALHAWTLIAAVAVVALALGHAFVPLGRWASRRPAPAVWWVIGVAVVVIAALWRLGFVPRWTGCEWAAGDATRMVVGAAGQTVLCLMLVLPAAAPRRPDTTHERPITPPVPPEASTGR